MDVKASTLVKVYQLRMKDHNGNPRTLPGVYLSIQAILNNFPLPNKGIQYRISDCCILVDLIDDGVVQFDIYESEVIR